MSQIPHRTARPAKLLLLALLLAGRRATAEDGILFIHVTDPAGVALAGVQLGPAGGGSPTVTDALGKARIHLAPDVRAAQEIEVQIATGNGALAWVFISPWNGRVRVPSFAGSEPIDIILVHPGNRQDLLESVAGRIAVEKSVLTTEDRIT